MCMVEREFDGSGQGWRLAQGIFFNAAGKTGWVWKRLALRSWVICDLDILQRFLGGQSRSDGGTGGGWNSGGWSCGHSREGSQRAADVFLDYLILRVDPARFCEQRFRLSGVPAALRC